MDQGRTQAQLRAELDAAYQRIAELEAACAGDEGHAKALRESEDRFDKLFRASPEAAAIVSFDDSRFAFVNQAFQNLTGYAEGELIGKSTLELGIWADPEERADIRKMFLPSGRLRDVLVHIRTRATWR